MVTTPKPPCNHVETGEKPLENSSVTTVTTSIIEIVIEGGKSDILGGENKIYRPLGHNREKGGYGSYGGYTPAAPEPSVDREVALGEPDAGGRPRLVGEFHPKAHLTDAQVEAIREEYEAGLDGTGPRIGYRALAKKYDTYKRTIRDIVSFRRRNARAESWAVPRRRRRRKKNIGLGTPGNV